ncbi:MAG TPA: FecR domain-containing protein [Flavitalea sp.]|nr:FecR domain-containing protein [Flavitalea sp.]
MEKEILNFLLRKHIAGTLTEDEKIELSTFVNRKQSKEAVVIALEDLLLQHTPEQEYDEKRFMPLVKGILSADGTSDSQQVIVDSIPVPNTREKPAGKKIWWLLIIAILIAAAAFAYFYYFRASDSTTTSQNNNTPIENDAAPGGNKAVLTISDGKTFALDSAKTGLITQQGNVRLTKAKNDELRYTGSSHLNEAIMFNTVSTPRGGQYQILLSDGSRVKLNSISSITYPVSFSGSERNVTITGEVYFEIADNAGMPFKVRAYDMEVEVQGTDFNINAYTDEPAMKTTLLKGSLKLNKNSSKQVLQSLQQGQFDNEGNFTLEKNVDVNEVMAWRNGMFNFNNADLKIAMRQIGRWYDVDVIYEIGARMEQPVTCKVQRNVNLSEVVQALEKNDIRCRIDGKTLIVLP